MISYLGRSILSEQILPWVDCFQDFTRLGNSLLFEHDVPPIFNLNLVALEPSGLTINAGNILNDLDRGGGDRRQWACK